jgi:hypothetical protein
VGGGDGWVEFRIWMDVSGVLCRAVVVKVVWTQAQRAVPVRLIQPYQADLSW